jgi:hypothetical protein
MGEPKRQQSEGGTAAGEFHGQGICGVQWRVVRTQKQSKSQEEVVLF